MKKILFIIGLLLLLPISVNASNANISITSSKINPIKNDIITVTVTVSSPVSISSYEYTLDYNRDDLSLIKGNAFNAGNADSDETTKFVKEFDFKVNNATKSTITVKSYAVREYGSSKEMSVKILPLVFGASNNNTVSKNNDLSSLTVTGYQLNPNFDKDTTKYYLDINDKITEIEVIATPYDSNSVVKGNTKYRLAKGENKIDVTVTSQSGDTKVYSIYITLGEKNPIVVRINKKEYTVLKNISKLIYKDYEIKKIKIKDIETDSLYNEKANITLVGLKDDDDNVSYYIYDSNDNSYNKYFEIKNDSITLVPLKFEGIIPDYELVEENIDNNTIMCYKSSKDEKTCLIYGVNLKDNKNDFYEYNFETKTIKKYDNNNQNIIYSLTKERSNKRLLYLPIIGIFTVGIIILIVLIKKYKSTTKTKRISIK